MSYVTCIRVYFSLINLFKILTLVTSLAVIRSVFSDWGSKYKDLKIPRSPEKIIFKC